MNCSKCLENLDTYLDRELTDDELNEVRRHLAHCPPCEDYYLLKASLKRLVKVCCDQGVAPEHLRSRLREILF
ncbi:MAG TPA: mycothiol system anti-sigma-R factor [Candidatus Dormibacteraeota bacterium]